MTASPDQATILLVEDTAVMRKIEKKALADLGYTRVIEAVDGRAARAVLEGDAVVDLVISDWNMPVMDGYELLCWVRGDARRNSLPFLMATGQGDKAQEQKAVAAGVSSFVAKPFNAEELQAKIHQALGLATAAAAPVERGPRVGADGRLTLKVAHIQITDHLILGVARHLLERGEAGARRLKLETACLGGWNPVQQALESGAVDAAFILAPIAMDLFSYGAPIKLVLLAHRNGSICVRSRSGEFQAPYSGFYKGKSFLIPHKLSVHHMLAHLFFTKLGLRPGMVGEGKSDVNFEVVAPIRMQSFLQENPQAAGFMVAEPLGTRAIAAGAASVQFLSSELWENHPCCVVAVRDAVIAEHPEAVQELVDLLVQAGRLVEQKPERAAEIGVRFLDPEGSLGLKTAVLKNVLTETNGIRTGDLFPDVEDLRTMHTYMRERMGIGKPFDMEAFVDARFAARACPQRIAGHRASRLHTAGSHAVEFLCREAGGGAGSKAHLNLEGKYLTFAMGGQEFGIDILKIKEIVGLLPIRPVPGTPPGVRGVVDLRGEVVPVIDLRVPFGMGACADSSRSCIVVLETLACGARRRTGIAVDGVSEVLPIRSADFAPTPSLGGACDTRHILGMAKAGRGVRMLLDIDHILAGAEVPV
jgi:ABC-type nitrate/sulfonate/bicarbonate transport system substrate-binding protein/chemotaxis signal transduction protein